MKAKLNDILTGTLAIVIAFMELIIDLFDNAWNWLRGLFIKTRPVTEETKNEKEKDDNTDQIEFRCQECGFVFQAEKEIIRFDAHAPMVHAPFDCPSCDSVKTMPVMFERDRYYEDEYRRLWKRTLFLRKLIS